MDPAPGKGLRRLAFLRGGFGTFHWRSRLVLGSKPAGDLAQTALQGTLSRRRGCATLSARTDREAPQLRRLLI